MRASLISLLTTLLAATTTAYTAPNYDNPPKGNAISKPGIDDPVEAGKPYTIEWKADTPGPISIVLLRGPSKNVKPIDTLADKIDNKGTFEWTPSKDLEPDTTHYGLMIVVEKTGQYQYSTQFGVKNPDYKPEDHTTATTTTAAPTTSTLAPPKPRTTSGNVINGPATTWWSSFPVTRTVCPLCERFPLATPIAFTTTSVVPIVASSQPTSMSSYGYSKAHASGLASSASRVSFSPVSDRVTFMVGTASMALVVAMVVL